jgi:endonuclease/exonuclease/phosphatase family metal-dependent hydrolase
MSTPTDPHPPLDQVCMAFCSILMKPGDIIVHDYRPESKARHVGPLRLLTFNIERGYKLDSIINILKAANADIIALQEIDIGCERSDNKATGMEIAKALEMNYTFICEFEELKSLVRSPSSQGGGFHGNGILSRFDFGEVRVVEHSRHPIDWEKEGEARFKEPRRGLRRTLAVTIKPPSLEPILVYTAHLECFCGMLDRFWQVSDIFKDARARSEKHQCIMGDLNTLGNGVARLGRNYCNDVMRWRSLGYYEAEIFDQCVLQCKGECEVSVIS